MTVKPTALSLRRVVPMIFRRSDTDGVPDSLIWDT